MPALEDDELPQAKRVIARAADVLMDERRGRRPARSSRAADSRGDSSVSANSSRRLPRNQTSSGTPNPCLRRSISARRKEPGCHFLQHVLPAAVPDLQRGRQRRGEVDHLVVEQRHARLDRVRHAHAIDFRQDVFGQVRLDVEPHHLARPTAELRVAIEDGESARCSGSAASSRWRASPSERSADLVVGGEEADRRRHTARARRARCGAGSVCRWRPAAAAPTTSPATRRSAAARNDRSSRRVDPACNGRIRRTARRRRRQTARRSRASPRAATRTTSESPTNRRTARRSATRACRESPTPSGVTTSS